MAGFWGMSCKTLEQLNNNLKTNPRFKIDVNLNVMNKKDDDWDYH